MVFEGHASLRNRELDTVYYGAYMAGFFAQPRKKIPEYDKFAPRQSKPKPMTADAMKNMAMIITAAFGGTIN